MIYQTKNLALFSNLANWHTQINYLIEHMISKK